MGGVGKRTLKIACCAACNSPKMKLQSRTDPPTNANQTNKFVFLHDVNRPEPETQWCAAECYCTVVPVLNSTIATSVRHIKCAQRKLISTIAGTAVVLTLLSPPRKCSWQLVLVQHISRSRFFGVFFSREACEFVT